MLFRFRYYKDRTLSHYTDVREIRNNLDDIVIMLRSIMEDETIQPHEVNVVHHPVRAEEGDGFCYDVVHKGQCVAYVNQPVQPDYVSYLGKDSDQLQAELVADWVEYHKDNEASFEYMLLRYAFNPIYTQHWIARRYLEYISGHVPVIVV